jgi:rhomboid protease GluP
MFDETSRAEPLDYQPPAPPRAAARPFPVITYILIALNVSIFALMVAKGVSPTNPAPEDILAWGADFGPYVAQGQWWRLFTACFLHFGIIHIAFNMYVLYQVGVTTEVIYGRAKYLLIYLLSGVLGNVVSLYVHPVSVGAGASGAIFGIYGAFLGFLWIRRKVIHKPALDQMVKSAVTFLGINLVYGLLRQGTDLSAHIGGLLVGFALGCYLSHRRTTS